MSLVENLLRAYRRYRNRKARERRVVYTWGRWEHTRAVQANRWRLWTP
jgi:hypothetical protein